MEKPILANEEVFEDIQQNYTDKLGQEVSPTKNQDLPQIETSRLKSMLKDAILKEDYELAAKIQEELNRR